MNVPEDSPEPIVPLDDLPPPGEDALAEPDHEGDQSG
jgi:hypothetical protein